MKTRITYWLFVAILLTSCAAPRSVVNSGKVTPHKQFRLGSNFSGNMSTSVASSLFEGAISTADDLINNDTITFDSSIPILEKVALSYSLDPIGTGYDFFVRYGLYKRVDIGYKFASGVHVFDAMYQFMGSTGNDGNPNGMCGSIGLQYSSQSYSLPFGLNTVQKILGFDLKRKDLFIPIIFSVPIGEEEKYGAFSFGLAYNQSFINYGFNPDNIFYKKINSTTPILIEAVNEKKNYHSLGMFVNVKAGYEFIYLVTSLSVFYQNYGSYNVLNNTSLRFSGFTFIPTIGIQFTTGKLGKMKKSSASFNNE